VRMIEWSILYEIGCFYCRETIQELKIIMHVKLHHKSEYYHHMYTIRFYIMMCIVFDNQDMHDKYLYINPQPSNIILDDR
jgi:hypothetical protein